MFAHTYFASMPVVLFFERGFSVKVLIIVWILICKESWTLMRVKKNFSKGAGSIYARGLCWSSMKHVSDCCIVYKENEKKIILLLLLSYALAGLLQHQWIFTSVKARNLALISGSSALKTLFQWFFSQYKILL